MKRHRGAALDGLESRSGAMRGRHEVRARFSSVSFPACSNHTYHACPCRESAPTTSASTSRLCGASRESAGGRLAHCRSAWRQPAAAGTAPFGGPASGTSRTALSQVSRTDCDSGRRHSALIAQQAAQGAQRLGWGRRRCPGHHIPEPDDWRHGGRPTVVPRVREERPFVWRK